MPSLSDHSVLARDDAPVGIRRGTFHRAFDSISTALGLLVLSPLFVAIAVAIKFDDGGPVFYSQDRIGKNFRRFRVYKFRSMVSQADRQGLLTTSADARITRIGHVLRRYKLDELPQLFNVLRGEMRLVGARPEVEKYVRMFPREYSAILQDHPGITDPASLICKDESQLLSTSRAEQLYIREILPRKLSVSLDYQKRRTFYSDLRIILKTLSGLIS
jgi:lipopolysaccharide/colanic/teichoic acid biosynthesis glycosyltransferase